MVGLLCFYVVAEEEVLVAEVELAVGYDGVGPGIFAAVLGLFEAAVFFVGFGGGFDEDDLAAAGVFFAEVEAVVGVGDGAFADLRLLPLGLAADQVLAG